MIETGERLRDAQPPGPNDTGDMIRVVVAFETDELPPLQTIRSVFPEFRFTEMPAVDEQTVAELEDSGFEAQLITFESFDDLIRFRCNAAVSLDAIVLLTTSPFVGAAQRLSDQAKRIRAIDGTFCLPGSIRVSSLPIVLVDRINLLPPSKKKQPLVANREIAWCYWLRRHKGLCQLLVQVVRHWRRALYRELEYVGYGLSFNPSGEVELNHVMRPRPKEGYFFSHNATLEGLRASRYLLIREDVLHDFEPYVKLRYTLNYLHNIAAQQRTKPETVLQRLFHEFPVLIYRDLFSAHWAQPRLYYPGTSNEYIIPDFVLKPKIPAPKSKKWEVLEIKRPDVALVSQGEFTRAVLDGLKQLRRYEGFFERPDTGSEQIRKFGSCLRRPRKALLIGRRLHPEDASLLEHIKRESEFNDIAIIDYDELFSAGQRRLLLSDALLNLEDL